MKLVRLIVSGVAEQLGMPSFLAKIFPGAQFETQKVDSFTSCRMTPFQPDGANEIPVIDKFANAIIASVEPGRKSANGPKPDLVLGIDDIELWNLDQPRLVVDEFSAAIIRCIDRLTFSSSDRKDRLIEGLIERASFHLLSPMLEAYFFADANAVGKANGGSVYQLVANKDLEDFESCDAKYLTQYANLPVNFSVLRIQPKTQSWYAKHPKEYLKYLSGNYRESVHGVEALKELDPKQAVNIANQSCFLRSMVQDLADGLGTDLPLCFAGQRHPETSRQQQKDRVLRNV